MTSKELTQAGFTVIANHGARWVEVIDPTGEHGAVWKQSASAWHYFAKACHATANSCNAATCHLGALGEAIGTDSQLRTYRRGVASPPKALRSFLGVRSAMSQV